jgi:pimeloyl-ACP methyl ester carboxylesterase
MRAVLADPGVFGRLLNLHSPGILEPRLRALAFATSIPGTRAAFAWYLRRDPLRFVHKNVHYYDEQLKSVEEAHQYGDPLRTVEGSRAFANILGDVLAPRELTEFARALEATRPFPIPLLLLYARTDPMVPPWIGPRLHALVPSAELRFIENSSHFAHVDTPDLVLEEISRFFTPARGA